jgi:hypothetical protein
VLLAGGFRHGSASQLPGGVKSREQRLLKLVVGSCPKSIKILHMKLKGSGDETIFNIGRNRRVSRFLKKCRVGMFLIDFRCKSSYKEARAETDFKNLVVC